MKRRYNEVIGNVVSERTRCFGNRMMNGGRSTKVQRYLQNFVQMPASKIAQQKKPAVIKKEEKGDVREFTLGHG